MSRHQLTDNVGGDFIMNDINLFDSSYFDMDDEAFERNVQYIKDCIPSEVATGYERLKFVWLIHVDNLKLLADATSYIEELNATKTSSKRDNRMKAFRQIIVPAYSRVLKIYLDYMYVKPRKSHWQRVYRPALINRDNQIPIVVDQSFNFLVEQLIERLFQNICLPVDLSKMADVLVKSVTVRSLNSSTEPSIMFDDCSLSQNGVITIVDDSMDSDVFSSYMIPRKLMPLVENHSKTMPTELSQLFDNLSNNDFAVKEFILNTLSTSFCLSSEIKSTYGKILVFDDDGGTGKGLLSSILFNAIGSNCYLPFNFENVNDNRIVVNLKTTLLMVNPDGSNDFINSKKANILKNVATGDIISGHKLYQEETTIEPRAQVLICTNGFGKCEDKSSGWRRRLAIIKPEHKLLDLGFDDRWFSKLRSKETSDWLLTEMVIRATNILRSIYNVDVVDSFTNAYDDSIGLSLEIPTSIVENVDAYRESNQNVESFIHDVLGDADAIFPKDAYDRYKKWCEDNAENAYGETRFKSLMERFGYLSGYGIKCSISNYPNVYEYIRNQKILSDPNAAAETSFFARVFIKKHVVNRLERERKNSKS